MGDAARPSDDVYQRVLQESFHTWSFYMAAMGDDASISCEALDLQNLAFQVPSFLGDGLTPQARQFHSLAMKSQQRQGKAVCL